ncbi:MAG: ribose-5-phosphate isomerase A, partial [Isosphaeraceae bacterium]
DPEELDRLIRAIPGVVGNGLFLGMAHAVLVQEGDNVRVMERQSL